MDSIARLLNDGPQMPGGQSMKKRGEGASQDKLCLRFVPLPTNRNFNKGRFLSLPYPNLVQVDGTLDFQEVVIEYATHRLTLTGPNLKPLADRIEARTLGDVLQMDAAHARYYASPEDSLHQVTLTVKGRDVKGVLAAIDGFRRGLQVQVDDLGPVQAPGGPMIVVTGLAVESLKEEEEA